MTLSKVIVMKTNNYRSSVLGKIIRSIYIRHSPQKDKIQINYYNLLVKYSKVIAVKTPAKFKLCKNLVMFYIEDFFLNIEYLVFRSQ